MDRIDAMQAFVAVADLQGFAPAARKLGLSPSGVTRLIAALEQRLGARLLQRTTRQVALTDVGARYLERARRILSDVEEAEGSAQDERTRPSGRLVVSAPVGFGRLHVSPVMSAYLARYPEVSGELRLSDRMINLVEDGVDLAIRIGHLPDSSLVARQVGEMRRIVVASDGYLKARGGADDAGGDRIARDHPVRRDDGAAGLAFCRRGPRNSRRLHAAVDHQQRRRRDPICRAGWWADAGAGLSGGRCDQARPAQAGAGKIRTAAVADPYRLFDVTAVVGQGADLCRSRDRDQRLGFWRKMNPSPSFRDTRSVDPE